MASTRKSSSARSRKRSRRLWRNILLALFALSLFQYASTGSVSWPGALIGTVGDTLRDYATRPGASWREAADKLEEIGSAREGLPVPTFDISGRVVRVADGDTISVLDRANKQHKIRLQGIDTPEREQRYGRQAWDALAGMVEGKTVGVVIVDEDSYGRSNGIVYLNDHNINLAMVAAGHAWWYRYYAPNNQPLRAAEESARAGKLGLWTDSDPVPPWDWRKQQRYSKP